MTNRREKGKRYERHVAGLFRAEGYEARRGQQYSGANGDADVIGVRGLHIECKHQERMQLYDWMSQSKADARDGEIPIVIHKRNDHADLVTMEFGDWIRLYREWECSVKEEQE